MPGYPIESKSLKKFKISLNTFFLRKTKSIKTNFLINGNFAQKKVWSELRNIKFGKLNYQSLQDIFDR